MSIVYGVRFGMAVYGVAAEMEALVSQSERGLEPGCAECEQLENQLIAAREQDRRERNREDAARVAGSQTVPRASADT